jgi:hypothetical protein
MPKGFRGFQKGHAAWNKGETTATNSKLAEAGKKISATLKGRVIPPEQRAKISATLTGRPLDPIRYEKAIRNLKSRPNPFSYLKFKGPQVWNWKGGITPANVKFRVSIEYNYWRDQVFRRDDYRCFDCGQRGGQLEAHHLYPFALFPRLRLMVENGITLCKECHKRYPRGNAVRSTYAGMILAPT